MAPPPAADRRLAVVPAPPSARRDPAAPPPRAESSPAPAGLVSSGASADLRDRREPPGAFAWSPPRSTLFPRIQAPCADVPGGSTTRAAALELLRRPPAAAADLGVAVADLGVSAGFAVAPGFSLRCRLPPPDTDAGVCSPSAARFRVRIRSVGKNVLHSFGLSRLCGGVNGGLGQDPRGRNRILEVRRVEAWSAGDARLGVRARSARGAKKRDHVPVRVSSRSMLQRADEGRVSAVAVFAGEVAPTRHERTVKIRVKRRTRASSPCLLRTSM